MDRYQWGYIVNLSILGDQPGPTQNCDQVTLKQDAFLLEAGPRNRELRTDINVVFHN